jgi:hypothetical protein
MDEHRRRKIDQFRARADDGREVTIVVYQNYIIVRATLTEPEERIEGQRESRTTDGRDANRKSDTEFEVLDPDGPFIVRRI